MFLPAHYGARVTSIFHGVFGQRSCALRDGVRLYAQLPRTGSVHSTSVRFRMPEASRVADVDDHLYDEQLQAKVGTVKRLFEDFRNLPQIEVLSSSPQHYRCRCEFSVWHEGDALDYVMYENVPGEKKPARRKVEYFPIASKLINELMPVVRRRVQMHGLLRHKLFQVNFHTTTVGNAMVTLIYHKRLAEVETAWRALAAGLRVDLMKCDSAQEVHIIGRSRGCKITVDADSIMETQEIDGRTYTQLQPEGVFSQPNGAMSARMVSWASRAVREFGGDCLELYCGIGNFTVPMSRYFRRVVATEVSKAAVAAARRNALANDRDNIFMVRMSSEEFVEAWTAKAKKNRLSGLRWDEVELKTLVVDPPRAGLDKDTEALMRRFERILYISCNPETLHANLLAVKETHRIDKFAIFDQFPCTPHVECGVYLVRESVAT